MANANDGSLLVVGVRLQVIVVLILHLAHFGLAVENLTASFVFGDSLVDAGNNNYLATLSKADIPPQGCDFKPGNGKPTGRYTNGRIIPDIIADELRLGVNRYSPPYLAPSTKGKAILHGVNYASGGSGILNSTGSFFGGRIPLPQQVENFGNTREQLIKMLGQNQTQELLSKSIFSFIIGANDFINNYLVPFLSTPVRALVSADAFIDSCIVGLQASLKRMHELGARKLVVANVGPIGCIPYQRAINGLNEDQCAAMPNDLARRFNVKLKQMLLQLNDDFPNSVFVYADTYAMVSDIIVNYQNYGFISANKACCGSGGVFRGYIPCGTSTYECTDHSKYVFWDPYHPSEAANVIVARGLIDGGRKYMSPMNIRQLISLP